jgi:hypothetical protein
MIIAVQRPCQSCFDALVFVGIASTPPAGSGMEPRRVALSNVSQRAASDNAPTVALHRFKVWLAR